MAVAASVDPFAITIFLSAISTSVLLTVVVVPSTVRLPCTITLPLAVTVATVISSVINCPATVTLLNSTSAVVETSCPIDISPVLAL